MRLRGESYSIEGSVACRKLNSAMYAWKELTMITLSLADFDNSRSYRPSRTFICFLRLSLNAYN